MQTEPNTAPSPPAKRPRLNLALRPQKRGYVCLKLKLDPELWVRWTAFQARIAAGTGRRRVDRHALAGAALAAYMARHKAWEGPGDLL